VVRTPKKRAPGPEWARRTKPGLGASTLPVLPSIEEIEARLALDDHTGALELARTRLRADPADAKAARVARRCEETLTEMYEGRIGDFSQRVRVAMAQPELQWLSIDHRAGFMLSRVDGMLTVEELVEISGMPKLDALRTLHDLLTQKVVELDRGR
jgi:hypothetical protein